MTDPCAEALTELFWFLDGELTVERRERISVHLDECGHCDSVRSVEIEVRRVIALKCRDDVPEQLRARIAEALGLTGNV